jgi:predicted outer membrane repeat protein
MHRFTWQAAICAATLMASAAAGRAQSVWYVDDDAPPGGNGQSWAAPFSSLQHALDAAQIGDAIYVAGGTYVPTAVVDPGEPRTATFTLEDDIALRGGYAGLADPGAPDTRDIALYPTILSGDRGVPGDDADNCFHVADASSRTAACVLDGLTITGGRADGTWPQPQSRTYGGGIHIVAGDATLVDCTITGNVAHYKGGGVYCDGSHPTLVDCTLSDNHTLGSSSTAQGGGLSNVNGSSPTLIRCCFDGNTSGSTGGAMYIPLDCDPVARDCTFSNNSAAAGGAILALGQQPLFDRCRFIENHGGAVAAFAGEPRFTHCTFLRNVNGFYGGAIMTDDLVSPIILDSTFIENQVTIEDGGAIMLLTGGFPEVRRCTFFGNTAARFGGAITSAAEHVDITHCVFSGNTAQWGGAIQMYQHGVREISDCTFFANAATHDGGGMYVIGSTPFAINNCIFWENSDPDGVDEASQIEPPANVATLVNYSLIQGLSAIQGVGNIDAAPLFTDPDGADGQVGTPDDNLRLLAGSPALNSGDPTDVPTPGVTDLDRHAAVLCGRADMGAYEFGVGDADCDEDVDAADFAAWPSCLTGPDAGPYDPSCLPLDADFDNDIDLADLSVFMRRFAGS